MQFVRYLIHFICKSDTLQVMCIYKRGFSFELLENVLDYVFMKLNLQGYNILFI